MEKIKFKYNVNERPKKKKEHLFLSIQHVFAMFGSTVLVPTLVGLDVSVSLFTAGLGTLIYMTVTKNKVPVFIGSSFAYIAILTTLNKSYGANGIANAVISVGIIYLLISIAMRFLGTKWLDKILPPIVIGPVIVVIGMSLAPVAVSNSGLVEGGSYINTIIALSALIIASYTLFASNKSLRVLPIIMGIIGGYTVALIIDPFVSQNVVDTSLIFQNGLFTMPNFQVPYLNYHFTFDLAIFLSILPLVLVTVAEHIGDHTVSSSMIGKNFLKDPGLSKTLLGDGLATLTAGLLGGVVNTTYAENTGVIMLTKVASVSVIKLAAIFAMLLAFIGPVAGFISSIPIAVMGGISILLFGMIAQNGIRIISASKVDLTHSRNLVIVSVILVLGIGQAIIIFTLGDMNFSFNGMSLAALVGILFHLILPNKEVSYSKKKV